MKFGKKCLGIFMAALLLVAPGMAEEQTAVTDQVIDVESVEAVEVTGLTLNETKVSLDYSQMVTLTAAGVDSDARISWTTSDKNVAALSNDSGESVSVRAVDPGEATITCTSGEEEVTCAVTVWEPSTLQITGVDYPATFYINNGRGWSLREGTLASNVDLKTLTSVILDSNGEAVVEPYTREFGEGVQRYEIRRIDNAVPFSSIRSEGTYTWRLSATDASDATVQLDMPIEVQSSGDPQIACEAGAYASLQVAHILITPEAATVFPGERTALTAEIRPYNAVNPTVSWNSSDPAVVAVDANGEVTGVALGTATITCTAVDGGQAVTSCEVSVVMKEGWQSGEDGGWNYYYPDGSMAVNRVVEIGGSYYGFDGTGKMWDNSIFTIGSESYVAQEGGKLLVNQWYQNGELWYYCGATGAMQTGWLKLGEQKYHLDANGAMQTSWVQDNGAWYYFDENGVMQTGWLQKGEDWYYLDSEGVMQTGWVQDGDKWYYLDGSGVMLTGQQEIDGKTYDLGDNGVLVL